MILKRIGLIGLVLGVGLGTAACTDGYGFSGLSVGYGSGGYYGDGYDTGYGYGYDSAYGSPYYGWYDDFYYPGTGVYVYDQYRRPYRWNDGQRRYWEGRRNNWRGDRNYRNDWNGFQRNDNRDDRYDGNRRTDGDRTWNRNDRRWDNNQGTDNRTWQRNDGDRRDWRNRRNDGMPGTRRPGTTGGGYSGRGNRDAAPVIGVSPQAAVRTSPAPAEAREDRRGERGRGVRNGPYVNVRPE